MSTGRQGRMRALVNKLAQTEGRISKTPAHDRARQVLRSEMQAVGLNPGASDYELPYQWEGETYVNLFGSRPGSASAPAVLLIAHTDTCGAQPGAGDNAAALAILLELAREFGTNLPLGPVSFLFPDAEEPPYFLTPAMGSTRFWMDQRQEEVHLSIVLDLVGHRVAVPHREQLLFLFGMESHGGLPSLLQRTAPAGDLEPIFLQAMHVGDHSDYHVHRDQGEPFLFLTGGRWEHYHRVTDLPEHLDLDRMDNLVDYLLRLIRSFQAGEFQEGDRMFMIQREIESIRRLFAGDPESPLEATSSHVELLQALAGFRRRYNL